MTALAEDRIIDRDLEAIVEARLPWHRFAGATVLVSGASGFLPAYMVETLLYLNRNVLDRPAHIIAVVRNEERARVRFARFAASKELRFIVQDISRPFIEPVACDYIIHAASQASPVYYKVDPVGTLSANILGTYHLLENARHRACEGFLFFSSGDVYGQLPSDLEEVREDMGGFLDPTSVRSCYGESKRAGETMAACWAHQHGIPTRIVRPGHTYGPGMKLDDGRVFADFVRDIVRGGPIVLHSDGRARRSFCYLADAAVAFFTVLLHGENGQAYNVSNPAQECSIAELADRLALLFANRGVTVERRTRIDNAYLVSPARGTKMSIAKLKGLGWNPEITIEEGFSRTVQWYLDALRRA